MRRRVVVAMTHRSQASVFFEAAGKLSKMNHFAELDWLRTFGFSFLM
jgi:hypothetical protein